MTTKSPASLPPIIPINDETNAMLAYAASREGRAKIEEARQEIRDGKGIAVTPEYFAKMNQRIDERAANNKGA